MLWGAHLKAPSWQAGRQVGSEQGGGQGTRCQEARQDMLGGGVKCSSRLRRRDKESLRWVQRLPASSGRYGCLGKDVLVLWEEQLTSGVRYICHKFTFFALYSEGVFMHLLWKMYGLLFYIGKKYKVCFSGSIFICGCCMTILVLFFCSNV